MVNMKKEKSSFWVWVCFAVVLAMPFVKHFLIIYR
jgi:hypothetical protein